MVMACGSNLCVDTLWMVLKSVNVSTCFSIKSQVSFPHHLLTDNTLQDTESHFVQILMDARTTHVENMKFVAILLGAISACVRMDLLETQLLECVKVRIWRSSTQRCISGPQEFSCILGYESAFCFNYSSGSSYECFVFIIMKRSDAVS